MYQLYFLPNIQCYLLLFLLSSLYTIVVFGSISFMSFRVSHLDFVAREQRHSPRLISQQISLWNVILCSSFSHSRLLQKQAYTILCQLKKRTGASTQNEEIEMARIETKDYIVTNAVFICRNAPRSLCYSLKDERQRDISDKIYCNCIVMN